MKGNFIDDRMINFSKWGEMRKRAKDYYARGEEVVVVFWGAHPRNDLDKQKTFLQVERFLDENDPEDEANSWEVVAHDGDPETIIRWDRYGPEIIVTVRWAIPETIDPGKYRISYFGIKRLRSRNGKFRGVSNTFQIRE